MEEICNYLSTKNKKIFDINKIKKEKKENENTK